MITKEEYDACIDGNLAQDALDELINELDIERDAILEGLKHFFGPVRFYEALKYFAQRHDLPLSASISDDVMIIKIE